MKALSDTTINVRAVGITMTLAALVITQSGHGKGRWRRVGMGFIQFGQFSTKC